MSYFKVLIKIARTDREDCTEKSCFVISKKELSSFSKSRDEIYHITHMSSNVTNYRCLFIRRKQLRCTSYQALFGGVKPVTGWQILEHKVELIVLSTLKSTFWRKKNTQIG